MGLSIVEHSCVRSAFSERKPVPLIAGYSGWQAMGFSIVQFGFGTICRAVFLPEMNVLPLHKSYPSPLKKDGFHLTKPH